MLLPPLGARDAGLFGKIDLVPAGAQPFFVPLILIIVGAYLLVEPRTH